MMTMLCEIPDYMCPERASRTIGQYTRDSDDGHKGVRLFYVCEKHLFLTNGQIDWPYHFWYDFSHVIQGPWERKEGA